MADYIRTNGGDGYFELGSITLNSGTIFKFKATPRTAPEGFWLGNWSNWYGIYHPVQSNIQNQLKWYSTGGIEGVFYQGQSSADILDHSFEIETSTEYVKANGVTVSRNAPVNATFTSFHIGNSTNAGQFDARKPVDWEYFQIYQDGVLTLDLVPAYKNNQYCFKDRVSGDYLYGTGTIGGEVTSISVDIESITAEYSGTSTTVTVTADSTLTWTASTTDSWISLVNPTGAGNGSFTVVAAENKNYSERTGSVSLVSNGGDEITLPVSQEKKPVIVYDRPIYRSGNLVKKMYRSGNLIYRRLNPVEEPDDNIIPLTFEIITSGTILWKKNTNSAPDRTIQYRINNGNWASIAANDTAGTAINVSVGDIVQFKGNNASYCSTNYYGQACQFGGTATFYAYGNIMSLIYGDNFIGQSTLEENYTFVGLFRFMTGLTSHIAHKLIMPATTLTHSCYSNMFYGTNITTAPELPATNLTTSCYLNMFSHTPLISAPQLPATTLTQSCYNSMFSYCTNLTTAPELPATTLVNSCYNFMFAHCGSLNYVKCLATDISASYCTSQWLDSVAANGTFIKDSSMSSWTSGYNGIPSGWTVLDAE